jgi:hypothetical protein
MKTKEQIKKILQKLIFDYTGFIRTTGARPEDFNLSLCIDRLSEGQETSTLSGQGSEEGKAIKDALKMLRDYDSALVIEADKRSPNFTVHQKITPIIHRLRKIELSHPQPEITDSRINIGKIIHDELRKRGFTVSTTDCDEITSTIQQLKQ